MKKGLLTLFFLFLFAMLKADNIHEKIEDYFRESFDFKYFNQVDSMLVSYSETKNFYTILKFSPAWINPGYPAWYKSVFLPSGSRNDFLPYYSILNSNGEQLMELIRNVSIHGFDSCDYHYNLINNYLRKNDPILNPLENDVAKIDILLTDAFISLSRHLYNGKIENQKTGFNWHLKKKTDKIDNVLKFREIQRCGSVGSIVNLLTPRDCFYNRMQDELHFFRNLRKERWVLLPSGLKIKPGEENESLRDIRKKLFLLRYPLNDSDSAISDENFVSVLKLFQADHGIDVDGIVDKETVAALNTSPGKRVTQLMANLERLRWMPAGTSQKYIRVNIPDFTLLMLQGSDTIVAMKAVVGTFERQTPVFDAWMSYMVINPVWTLPPTILQKDVIPQLLKGSGYIDRKKMKIYKTNGTQVEYKDIDWSKINTGNFPYSIRQEPGGGNALGKIKFMFPNPHSIYIHDTPTKWSFTRSDRTFSSGCIRVEKPILLAETLLGGSQGWDREKIEKLMQQGDPTTARIEKPLEVRIIYLTAWCSEKGRVQFRNDIYHFDSLVVKGLKNRKCPSFVSD